MLRKIAVIAALAAVAIVPTTRAQEKPTGQGFSFRTGVELINVTATVTDEHGRFVPNLKADDFIVYEDGKPQPIQQFDSERVPVSLGIALDTSGSMAGEKIAAAQAALNRFLYDLLGAERRSVSLSLRLAAGAGVGLDERSPGGRPRAGHGAAVRRHRHLRHRRRSRAAGAERHAAQEGAGRDLRRQRSEQPAAHRRRAADDSRERSARLRDRHRRVGQSDADLLDAAGHREADNSPSPFPGKAPPPQPAPKDAAAVGAVLAAVRAIA